MHQNILQKGRKEKIRKENDTYSKVNMPFFCYLCKQ